MALTTGPHETRVRVPVTEHLFPDLLKFCNLVFDLVLDERTIRLQLYIELILTIKICSLWQTFNSCLCSYYRNTRLCQCLMNNIYKTLHLFHLFSSVRIITGSKSSLLHVTVLNSSRES
jgi:hypothetical protein